MSTFPTADQIATAIVTACRLTGEGPIATCLVRKQTSRARHIAFAALRELFPDARVTSLARLCGYYTPHSSWTSLNQARRRRWWRDDWVDEVVGSVVGDEYQEPS